MVVLNFYGKIEPICISEKLGLYIANLPNEEYNEWRNALAEELELAVKANKIYQEKLGTNYPCGIINLYQTLFPDELLPGEFEQEHYIKIADQMIFIYQDYDYTDMPLGGWDTNCFDGRLCEEDYSEKIIDFINFMAHSRSLYRNGRSPQTTTELTIGVFSGVVRNPLSTFWPCRSGESSLTASYAQGMTICFSITWSIPSTRITSTMRII